MREELYRIVQEKKNALIKSKRIKKDKSELEVVEEDVPFDIPNNWKWVCWGEIVNIVSARRVHQSDWRKEGIPFYRAREIAKLADNGFVDNDMYISEELYDEFSKSGVPSDGDLMVSAVGTLGKTYVVKRSDHFYYNAVVPVLPQAKLPLGVFPQGLALRRTRREIYAHRLLVN